MRLHFATNVISDPEELYLLGARNILATFAWHEAGPDFAARAVRNYDGFWCASEREREGDE